MNLLEIDGLSVTYGEAILALEDVSLRVDEGQAVALLGANGAGKTTTLRAIGGLLRFHGGQVRGGRMSFDGRPVGRVNPAGLVERGIAQTLEGRRVFADLTVEQNLRVGAFAARARRAEAKTRRELLELFPRLAGQLTRPAGLLSGGEQQMLAIARALMAQPRLLLLDEPSLGLAPLVVAEIAQALRRVTADGTALLLVDQSTALALRATDDAYLLETGCVRDHRPTTQLLSDDGVRACYLGTTAGAERVAEAAEEAAAR